MKLKPKTGIIRWSKLSEDQKNYLLPVIEAVYEKPTDEFDGYGLRHSLEHLDNIGKSVIFFPLEYMAEYVDVITKTKIDEQDTVFLLTQILRINSTNIDKINFQDLNATALGNLAYVALHAESESARNIAEWVLEKFFDWYELQNEKTIK